MMGGRGLVGALALTALSAATREVSGRGRQRDGSSRAAEEAKARADEKRRRREAARLAACRKYEETQS